MSTEGREEEMKTRLCEQKVRSGPASRVVREAEVVELQLLPAQGEWRWCGEH